MKLACIRTCKKKLTVVKKTKGATICRTASGKQVTFLTPSGKVTRYGRELRSGVNSRTGKKLNACAAGYRMGYRAALGEQASIYKKKTKVGTAGKRKENPYNDFVYTPTGRIKGSYNVDGFFEPD